MEGDVKKTERILRGLQHSGLCVALLFSVFLLGTACSDDANPSDGGAIADTGRDYRVPCTDDSDCNFLQRCDTDRGVCVGVPAEPAPDLPVEDQGTDATPDEGVDLPPEDVPVDTPDDLVEVGEDPDTEIRPDVIDADDGNDGEDLTDATDTTDGGDVDVDGGADVEIDVPPEYCPVDHLEMETSNNSFTTASSLHESAVAGSVGVRSTAARERHLCDDLAFRDRSYRSSCVDDDYDCECELITNLGACGNADPDFHKFSLVPGDSAFVRLMFEAPFIPGHITATLIFPPTETSCVADSCDTGFECYNGFCHAIVSVGSSADPRWVDSGTDGIDDAIELAVGGVPTDDSAAVPYWLLVSSQSEVKYSVLVQVDPKGRTCYHDTWDAGWDVYSASGEVGCESGSDCDLVAGTLDTSPTGFATICPWDGQDYFRHEIIDAGGAERQISVRWDATTDAVVSAGLTGTPLGIDVVPFEERAPGHLRLIYCESTNPLAPGTYTVKVTADRPLEIKVNFFETALHPADCPD